MFDGQFPAQADILLILGGQGSGKNGFAVSQVKDDVWAKMTGLIMPQNSGLIIKARAINKDDKKFLRAQGIKPHPFNHVRVFSDDGKQSRIIWKPKEYLPVSPVRVFSNFHLYGMFFAYVGMEDVIEHIDDDLMTDAWVLSDESAWLDRRFNMTVEGKEMAKFTATIRKRRLHFLQLVQYSNQIEGRYIQFSTNHILCSYDKITQIVTYDQKKDGVTSRHSFWLPYYWNNYDTTERVPTGQYNINRALKKFHALETANV